MKWGEVIDMEVRHQCFLCVCCIILGLGNFSFLTFVSVGIFGEQFLARSECVFSVRYM